MGDSDVKLKHKVQLRKKVEKVQPRVEPTSEPAQPQKSNKWIWWVVGVIVLCTIGYFLFSKSDKEQPVQVVSEFVEEVVANDSVAETNEQTEGVQDETATEETPVDALGEQPTEEPIPEAKVPVTNAQTESIQSNTEESTSVTNDVEAEAMKVIRGDYGIGQERKAKLGSKYQPIQNRVNELKREGVF